MAKGPEARWRIVADPALYPERPGDWVAIFARKTFIKAGLDYDYWMAREHVNPVNNLVSFVRYYFDDVNEHWLPTRIPSMDLNLLYIAHIRV